MRTRFIILIAVASILLAECGKGRIEPLTTSDIFFIKDQDQISVSENREAVWSGFKTEGKFYVSDRKNSKLIIFRKKGSKILLGLKYRLSQGNSEIFINGEKKIRLFPSSGTRTVNKDVTLLRGFNFIEFRTPGEGALKLAKIWTEKKKNASGPILNEGDKAVKFFSYGKGEVKIEGSGTVSIRKVEFLNGVKKVELKKFILRNNGGRRLDYDINFNDLGFIELNVISGSMNKFSFTFRKRKTRKKQLDIPRINGRPDVYIMLIDGCHASHLGLYGYERDTSPAIDRLAKESVVFENAYANASFTRSSVASIFTGFYPQRHKVLILRSKLPRNLFIMPEFFKSKGYKTGIITEAGNISMVFGFRRGVTEYHKAFFRWDDPRYLKKNNINFFKDWVQHESPLFTYVHFREPHFPIVPPPPYRDMFGKRISKHGKRVIFRIAEYDKKGHVYTEDEKKEIINDYDSSIRHVTDSVEKLVEMLKRKGKYNNSILIFTADHGEAVYEHGAWGHGSNVFNETTRVPLIVKFPKYFNLRNRRIKRLTQLVDLFPTLMSLYGESRVFDGESLFKSIDISEIDDRFIFSTSFNTPQSFGIRWRSWYYIIDLKDNSEKLYNLDTDPLSDISKDKKDILFLFRTKFLNWLNFYDNLDTSARNVDLKKLPKGERENLKSLGYIN